MQIPFFSFKKEKMKNIITLLSIILLLNLSVFTTAKHHHHHTNNKPTNTTTNNYFDLVSLGAKPNSKFDSSKALQTAWQSACGSLGQSTIVIPQGRFLVQSGLKFSGKGCQSNGIDFIVNGTIVAPSNFQTLNNSKTWLLFDNVNGVKINGGVFDGQGRGLWACKRSGNGGCPRGVETLTFRNSRNIEINGVTSLNSQLYHIVIDGCNNVKVQGANVFASGNSPNTDGIHVEASTNVTILNSNIGTGDDCISIAAGTTNLWIQEITCGPGHGISIGSLGKKLHEAGVYNVTVITANFTNTENGVRIKSWARPSDGYVKKVLFQHLTMVNAKYPMIIDQNYCPDEKGCPGQVSGVSISDVTYDDIHGSSASPIAIKLDCSAKHQCSDIKMGDINLSYKRNKLPSTSCTNSLVSMTGFVQPQSCQ